MLLAFQSQALHTDDETGHALAGSRRFEDVVRGGGTMPPPPDEHEFNDGIVRIVGALVNPFGHDPGMEDVVIAEICRPSRSTSPAGRLRIATTTGSPSPASSSAPARPYGSCFRPTSRRSATRVARSACSTARRPGSTASPTRARRRAAKVGPSASEASCLLERSRGSNPTVAAGRPAAQDERRAPTP